MSERKRQKRTLNRTTITKFEELPNELILICFNYFDFYHLYQIFFDLNQRFNQLIKRHANIYIDFESVPERKLLTFCFNLNQFLTTNEKSPVSMNISDEYKFNLIFCDDLFKNPFSKLKSLTIANIKIATLSDAIFSEETKLYKTLERLVLLGEISGEDYEIERLCSDLISSKMESLKYLNLDFQPYSCGCEHGVSTREDYVHLQFENLPKQEKSFSHLETFILGYLTDDDNETTTKISLNTLTKNVLPYLPKLKNLIVKSIDFDEKNHKRRHRAPSTTETTLSLPSNLQLIKLWILSYKNIQNDEKEKFLRKFFMNKNSSHPTTIKVFNINNESVLKTKIVKSFIFFK